MTVETDTAPAAPAPAAPAPAPAAPAPAPAAAPAPAPTEPTVEEFEFEETGDPGLDYALSFVARAGIDADHPALVAASQGNFTLLEVALAEKGVPGWEQAIALGKRALEGIQTKEAEVVKQVQASVTQVAEALGVDWEAAVTHARENATEEEAAKINELFKDPVTAKMAALWVSYAYTNAAGVSIAPSKQAVAPDAPSVAAPATGGTLTRAEFAAEAGKLHKKFGDAYNQTPEYRALANRLQRS